MITHQIEPCCENNKFKCTVRNNGFVIDWGFFDSEPEAETWGKDHDGEIGQSALECANEIINPTN